MRVVILDDDTALLRSLEIVLSGRGHAVRVFDDPAAACAYLGSHAAPEVLILDYMMPGLTGLDVLDGIGPHLPQGCRVILITGHCDALDPARLRDASVDAVLLKPLDLDRICGLVEPARTDDRPERTPYEPKKEPTP